MWFVFYRFALMTFFHIFVILSTVLFSWSGPAQSSDERGRGIRSKTKAKLWKDFLPLLVSLVFPAFRSTILVTGSNALLSLGLWCCDWDFLGYSNWYTIVRPHLVKLLAKLSKCTELTWYLSSIYLVPFLQYSTYSVYK